jgi:hypothetical protein
MCVLLLQIFNFVRSLVPHFPTVTHILTASIAVSITLALRDKLLAGLRDILEILYFVTVASFLEERLLHSVDGLRVMGVIARILVPIQAWLAFSKLGLVLVLAG